MSVTPSILLIHGSPSRPFRSAALLEAIGQRLALCSSLVVDRLDIRELPGQALLQADWERQNSGFTALLVTHDMEEAVALADRVILIEDGRIALDERIPMARPRQRSDPLFGLIEKKILDRVLQRPSEESPNREAAWPGTPAHGLRWAV